MGKWDRMRGRGGERVCVCVVRGCVCVVSAWVGVFSGWVCSVGGCGKCVGV